MTVRLLTGDALSMLRTLETESVQACICSPPYFQLRNYGCEGQLGMESTPADFIAALIAVFDEVKRVLRNDGTLWVVLGDSYSGSGKGPTTAASTLGSRGGKGVLPTDKVVLRTAQLRQGFHSDHAYRGIPAKNLLLIPERFAIAMQEAGWIVRQQICWAKTACMPESVRDRMTSAWEPIWMFAKQGKYFYDQEAVRQPATMKPQRRTVPKRIGLGPYTQNGGSPARSDIAQDAPEAGANMRNVWLLGPEPSRLNHYAGFPTAIPKRCILAGTSEKGACPQCGAPWVRAVERDAAASEQTRRQRHLAHAQVERAGGAQSGGTGSSTFGLAAHEMPLTRTTGWEPSCSHDAGDPVPQTVLDPFSGSGTTALVAERLGRHAIGIDLNETYVELSRKRIDAEDPLFSEQPTIVEPAPVTLPLFSEAI